VRIAADDAPPGPYPTGPDREVIDPGGSPLSVRYARPGDRFRPLGSPASTTVYRFLMGRKVPREKRPEVPVVTGEHGLLWVVGHRISETAKVREGTARRVLLSASYA
jgi:tRNA(Ile)-lysidine synthase